MSDSHSHRFVARQYRLASGVLTAGSLSAGMLLLQALVQHFHASLTVYYGVSSEVLQTSAHASATSISAGQRAVAVIGLIGTIGFVFSEHVRLRRNVHAASGRYVVSRASRSELGEAIVLRTALFSGVMLLAWILQASWINFSEGLGWGLTLAGWESPLPMASMFGLCALVGMFVGVVSVLGMRVLHRLRHVATRTMRRTVRRVVRVARRIQVATRTMLERFGPDILSRPPPVLFAP